MGYRLTLRQKALIPELFYGGSPARRISLTFRNTFSLPISPSTIIRYISDSVSHAHEAISYFCKNAKMGFELKTGAIWEIDEMYVPLRKNRLPWILVRDLSTTFIISENLATTASSRAIKETLVRAKTLAHKCPQELRCDGHPAYPKAVRAAFRGKTRLSIHERVGDKGQNQSIEGAIGAGLRSRLKTMRGLHSFRRSPEILSGLALDYNFVRPSDVLLGRPPAELALRRKPLDGKWGWRMLLGLSEFYKRTVLGCRRKKRSSIKTNQSFLDPFLVDL